MVSQLETPARTALQETPSSDNHVLFPAVNGLVQVFTCAHRSFFTSVMAQALRLAGQGTRVCIVQFLKGGINQGPDRPMRLGQNLDWIRCSLPRCIHDQGLEDVEQEALQSLWQHTQAAVEAGEYDLFVLDELSLAIHLGLISEAAVLDLLENRPRHIDIILTGPEMPPVILAIADQITEIRRSHRL